MDSNKPNHKAASTTELFSSAKVVAEAAQSTFSGGADKVDKAKVAGAAEDLLEGARQHGQLEEKGMGQYVDKAQDYLNKYSSGGGATTKDSEQPKPESHGDGGNSGGGVGDYVKMASGFLNK